MRSIFVSLIYAYMLLAWFHSCSAQTGSSGGTGTIRGRVTVSAGDEYTEEMIRGKELMRYQAHGAHSDEPVPPYRLSEEVVVYLEFVSDDAAFTPPAVHPQLNQHQMIFRPLVLPVLVGTTVDFPNRDDLYHNVFSYSRPKEFDLGKYPKGHSRSVTFDKPGVVKVYCDIHTYMFATILVLQNPYFTEPDDDGPYAIPDVPAGTYRLSCWYGRKKVATEPVTVREGQATVVNFHM